MKISPINALNVQRVRIQKNKTVPSVSYNNNVNVYTSPAVFFGKDLVSFKGAEFNQTLKENYFQLPAGCSPDSFQIDAGKALLEGRDVLVEAPTGTGKTAIAHYAATKNMAEGKTTFYTTPLKALSNQKLNEFRKVYGEENVGILTGDRRENVEAPIIIMTTEVYRNMALSHFYGDNNPLMENLGTVIFDEFHYLGDHDRGPVWEESVMYTPQDVQTLELSATIGNPKELEAWIGKLKGNNVSLVSIPSEARHVPLKFDMIETQSYNTTEKKIEKATRRGETFDEESVRVSKPKLSDFKEVVNKLNDREQLPAILFVFSRNYSREALEYFGKDGADLTTAEEKDQIEKIVDRYKLEKYIGADLDMEALKKGYAIHNAGIIPGQKELIEELFQKKLLKVVIATETLAAGINMPAKTVVISSPYKPCDQDVDAGKLLDDADAKILLEENPENEEEEKVPVRMLTSNEFKQMSGRAGRRGIDTVGYVYTLPTDRTTEQDFLYLEAIDCNPINSNYTPDYAFIAGYYEHNEDDSKLGEIFDKTFYVNQQENGTKESKVSELMEISRRKADILRQRGFLVEEDGALYPTMLANMASKVRGFNEITLTEMINAKELEDMTPQTLAMLAGAMAMPAKSKETAISYETDYSMIFAKTKEAIKHVYEKLVGSTTSMLVQLGRTYDSFSSYDEMMAFAQSIEKPDVSVEDIQATIRELGARRAKMYKITKQTGTMMSEEVVKALQNGETVPNKILNDMNSAVGKYKKRINASSIETYIEKKQAELDSLDTTDLGNKARARVERQQRELRQDIKIAQEMLYLDENIPNALADNFQFLKKNPPEQIKAEYNKTENLYNSLTIKDKLIEKIEALQNLEGFGEFEVYDAWDDIDKRQVADAFKKLLKVSSSVYSTEIENGIKATAPKYSAASAQILYAWIHMNQVNPVDSMTNWEQLIRMTSKTEMDEGGVYRTIMQSADLLSQMAEMAQVGAIQTQDPSYEELRQKLLDARQLIIKKPIEV